LRVLFASCSGNAILRDYPEPPKSQPSIWFSTTYTWASRQNPAVSSEVM
jgi:hypothetical protein